MKYRGIIFDLDGVIVHTDRFHYAAWKEIANRLNIPFDQETNHRLRGVSRMESLEIILEQYQGKISKHEKTQIAEKKNELYREQLNAMGKDDVSAADRAVLSELKKSGIRIAIGSSSRNARYILEQIHLSEMFDAVVDGSNITRSKPDPEVFLKAAKQLQLPPGDCLVVEDAKAGVDAAVAGGFDCAGMGDAANYIKTKYRVGCLADILTL